MAYSLFDKKLPQEIIDEFIVSAGSKYVKKLFELKYKFETTGLEFMYTSYRPSLLLDSIQLKNLFNLLHKYLYDQYYKNLFENNKALQYLISLLKDYDDFLNYKDYIFPVFDMFEEIGIIKFQYCNIARKYYLSYTFPNSKYCYYEYLNLYDNFKELFLDMCCNCSCNHKSNGISLFCVSYKNKNKIHTILEEDLEIKSVDNITTNIDDTEENLSEFKNNQRNSIYVNIYDLTDILDCLFPEEKRYLDILEIIISDIKSLQSLLLTNLKIEYICYSMKQHSLDFLKFYQETNK